MEQGKIHFNELIATQIEELLDRHAITGKQQTAYVYGTKVQEDIFMNQYVEQPLEDKSNPIVVEIHTCFNEKEMEETLYNFQEKSAPNSYIACFNYDNFLLFGKDEHKNLISIENYAFDQEERRYTA